ncbi:zinc finger protein 572-like [Paramacrobiotus metropolitanus]|uniref:zinc finger protein 572-like n=1 Tax=Paramacrobiotus metropolitanus TaxID=2943436 RepID=UPI00244588B8|nr:zinc finger protein 572-like [Paramacrobiotus metropolitanus]
MDSWGDVISHGLGLDLSWDRAPSYSHTTSSSSYASTDFTNQIFQPTTNRLMGTTGQKLKCKKCSLICESKAEHQLHTQTHARELKPYRCLHCPKCFANASYLSQHMRIHLGLKPYTCDMCKRCFTQLSHLQQHLRTHTGDKPYRCYFAGCQKAFSQLSNLQSHSRCHETDKPFRCYSCYKMFHDEAGLREHIPKHKESKHTKTHICNFCGKAYTQALYLASHISTKHQDKVDKQRMTMPQMADFLTWAKPENCVSFGNATSAYGQENFFPHYNAHATMGAAKNGCTALTTTYLPGSDYDWWGCWSKPGSSAFSAFNSNRSSMFPNLPIMANGAFNLSTDWEVDNSLQYSFGTVMNDSWAAAGSKGCFSENLLTGTTGQDTFRNFVIPV